MILAIAQLLMSGTVVLMMFALCLYASTVMSVLTWTIIFLILGFLIDPSFLIIILAIWIIKGVVY